MRLGRNPLVLEGTYRVIHPKFRSFRLVALVCVVDGDEAAPPLKVAKDTKLIHLVGDCVFLLKLDELNASFMEVFNLIH